MQESSSTSLTQNRIRKHFYNLSAKLDGDEPELFTWNHDREFPSSLPPVSMH